MPSVPEVEMVPQGQVLDRREGDAVLAQPLLPDDELGPALDGQADVVHPGVELGERGAGPFHSTRAMVKPVEVSMQTRAWPTSSTVSQPRHLGVELLADVEVGDAECEVVDSCEGRHLGSWVAATATTSVRLAMTTIGVTSPEVSEAAPEDPR